MTRIIIVRHGQSEANAKCAFAGYTDFELSSLGIKQAGATAKYIVEKYSIDRIYTSDLSRAYGTALPISEMSGLPLITNSELREIFAGEWEGKTFAELDEEGIAEICKRDSLSTATLIGCGADISDGLSALLTALLPKEGGPLIIDADAITTLAEAQRAGKIDLANAKRKVILTPHPGEFSRLTGAPVSNIQEKRLTYATEFSNKYGVTLILKGQGTIVVGGGKVLINSTGSSALSKAGSGDVLAGFTASLIASTKGEGAEELCAIGAYVHGRAGDALEKRYSPIGVTPSDLPLEMAYQLGCVLSEE
jgi:NAD(P)H-hydrate epimerase